MLFFFFFFSSRRRHTRLQGDWSSDVCSSDLLPVRAQRGEAVTLRPRAGRPADPGLLDGLVGGVQTREQAQLLLPLAELIERVAQPDHALAHALDLVREETVLVLEGAAAREIGRAHV